MYFLACFCGVSLLVTYLGSSASYALLLLPLLYWITSVRVVVIALLASLAAACMVTTSIESRLSAWLPEALEKQPLTMEVQLSGLVKQRGRYYSTKVSVLAAQYQGKPVALESVLLNWYGQHGLQSCQTWRVTASLKRPRGIQNPGGFDYEQYLLVSGVQAKGYVKEAELLEQSTDCLAHKRQQWHAYVEGVAEIEHHPLLQALTTGHKAGVDQELLKLFTDTGTIHVLVISGLHIGMLSGFVYGWVLLIRRLGFGLLFKNDWRPLAAMTAILAAFLYSAFAGFSVPSLRAAIMVSVFLGTQVIGVDVSTWKRLWLAMFVLLLLNPLSFLDVGFLLSFSAVILLCALNEFYHGRAIGFTEKLTLFLQGHILLSVGMAPVLLLFFQQSPLVGAAMNFVAVPLVSFIIIPLLFLSMLSWLVLSEDFGLILLADNCVAFLVDALKFLQSVFPEWYWVAGHPGDVAIISLGVFMMLFGLQLLPRLLGLCLVGIALLMPENTFEDDHLLAMHVLDVGQGQAVVVRTRNHVLLYDTGASWEGGSMAQRAIIPFLRYHNISLLDSVIVSHRDNDHAGGLQHVLEKYEVATQYMPEASQWADTCHSGKSWQWDGVYFEFLHPDDVSKYKKTNNQSCVLLITAGKRQLLLAGDIERKIERRLVKGGLVELDVLLAAHHGSKTSSYSGIVEKVAGGHVVYSAGYLNRFGHPHADVVARFQGSDVTEHSTAAHGMVSFYIDHQGEMVVEHWRERKNSQWFSLPE